MDLGRLGGAIGRGVRRGRHAVLARDEDHRSAHALPIQHAEGVPRHEEIAGTEHFHALVPGRQVGVLYRRGDRQARAVDQDVESAVLQRQAVEGLGHFLLLGHVHRAAADAVAAVGGGRGGMRLLETLAVDVGEHNIGAGVEQARGDRSADPAGCSSNQRGPARQRLGRGHAPQLGLFELPVLDAEGLALTQAGVAVDAFRAPHDVDGVDVVLARDAGGRLVAPQREHPHLRQQIDHCVRIPHRRTGRVAATPVISGVVGPIALGQLRQALGVAVDCCRCGRIGDHQGSDLGAQEMVRAGRTQLRQGRHLARAHELQHRWIIDEVPRLVRVSARQTAQHRQQLGCHAAARGRRQGLGHPPEGQALRAPLEPALGGVDGPQGAVVALLRIVGPGEQTVAAQHHPDGVRIVLDEFLQPQSQLEARPPPRQPADAVAVDAAGDALAVGRRGHRDHRVRMDMIDVLVGHKGVQRRVDGGGALAPRKGAVREHVRHLVLMPGPAIDLLELLQGVHAQDGEAVEVHAAQVPAGALDPHDIDHAPEDRVLLPGLDRGVATAVVGHPLVGSEQVGAVAQDLGVLGPAPHARDGAAAPLVRYRHALSLGPLAGGPQSGLRLLF